MRSETGIKLRTRNPAGNPALGIAGVLGGTLAAVSLVPEDPSPKGALFLSGLVMAMGLASAPLSAAFRDPKSIVQPQHLLMLAPIYWLLLDLIQQAYPLEGIYRPEAVASFVAIGLFFGAAWIGIAQRPWKLPRTVSRAAAYDANPDFLFGLILVAFTLGIFHFAYSCDFNPVVMISYLDVGRWSAPWARGAAGGWGAFGEHMVYFGYLLPAYLVVMARKVGWLNVRTVIAFALTAFFALFVAQGGGRRNIGVIFGVALILWMISQRRLKMRGMVTVAVCVASVLFLMQLILEYRNVGLAAALQGVDSNSEGVGYIHVDDNFYRLTQTISIIPQSYPHTGSQYFIYVFARPIPRVLWPGKPTDPGFNLADAVGMRGVSLSSSVIGEMYMANGFLALLVGGWFYGRLAATGSRLLSKKLLGAQVMYGAGMMALFVGVRSLIDLVLFSYVILAWVGMVWLSHLHAPMTPATGQPIRRNRRFAQET